ncbi:MAG: hypothetical protein QNJ91_16270 [Gammaproteobacteria bacterium]|nr:hypothetical protein [Gammaproteobacteria bacterium]
MKPSLLAFVIVVPLLTACATTSKQASWTNPAHAGQKISSVFIIGAARNDLTRRLFEDELARRLTASGVRAMTSYQRLDLAALDDKQAAVAKVRQLGADSVIFARAVGERDEQVITPGFTRVLGSPYTPRHSDTHWHDYYRNTYSVVSRPPTVTNLRVATVETNLYNADGDMVWSMRTDTTTASGEVSEKAITEFVDIVVKDLAANGLL